VKLAMSLDGPYGMESGRINGYGAITRLDVQAIYALKVNAIVTGIGLS